MGRTSKASIIAKAHKNPEYAAMSAKKLAPVIGVSQTTISLWRKRKAVEKIVKEGRVLQPKVTVASVKRKWEEKYMALSKQYDYLADRLIEMAKNADKHYNREKELEIEVAHKAFQFDAALSSVEHYRSLLAKEKKSWIKRLFNLKG